jgi:geranylgeranyl diphosphate synthase type II
MRVFNEQYQQYLEIVEDALQKILPIPGSEWPDEGAPKAIVDAVNYTLLSGGKRLRPVLLLAAFNTVSPTLEEALPFALAVEMIHNH